MRSWKFVSLILFLFFSKYIFADTSMVSIQINPNQVLGRLSPHMYGIFLEDINFAVDGGLYAEMVRNRSFEDIRPPEGCRIEGNWAITPGNFKWYIGVDDSIPYWKLNITGNATAYVNLDTAFPLNHAQYYSLKINIPKCQYGQVSIINEGYYGIAVEKGKNYIFSFYARSNSKYKGIITVSLVDENGKTYATQYINNIEQSWKKFSTQLTASATHSKLKLYISFNKPGIVWLDMVSLFPEDTWKKRQNGWRNDLMQMLVDLNPKFLRFPGGCVVEGITFDNAIQWKETIGDIAERPGHVNVWGYRSTDGIGYHEFLQMAEDLGAEPLFVVNVGLTCQARNSYSMPIDQLKTMIDDVLDAIEYANGPVSSYWGSARAINGHPKPFNLKFIEVGNENWGEEYDIRYEMFYDAIKSRYPEMIIIRSAHPTADRNPLYFPNNKGDILDLHYYRSPDWIFKNHKIFDDYPRIGKQIYIGEYACNEKVGRGNLYAALADATFLVALERNADIITMASYAPLFENDVKDGYKWPVNLIHFNNHKVYAMPTYYAQQMFNKYKGDLVVASELISDSVIMPIHYNLSGGAIGFDTYSTHSAFDDILVVSNNDTLLYENFDNPTTKFPLFAENGNWKIENGELHQTDATIFAHAYMGDTAWNNYILSFKAKKISGMEGFFMTLYRKDDNNWLRWNIGGWNNTQHALELRSVGNHSFITPMIHGSVQTNEWYRVKIKVEGLHIQCYLNDTLIHDVYLPTYNKFQRIYSVVTCDTTKNELIIKIVNPFPYSTNVNININDSIKISNSGQEIILTSKNPDDTNSSENPQLVYPKTRLINGLSNHFKYFLKPNSLTFLILKMN